MTKFTSRRVGEILPEPMSAKRVPAAAVADDSPCAHCEHAASTTRNNKPAMRCNHELRAPAPGNPPTWCDEVRQCALFERRQRTENTAPGGLLYGFHTAAGVASLMALYRMRVKRENRQ